MIETRKKFVEELREMEVGDIKVFPPERLKTAQSYANAYGFQWGRKFSVQKDNEKRQVIVKRTE